MGGLKISAFWGSLLGAIAVALAVAVPAPAWGNEIDKAIQQIEHALQTNPSGVSQEKIDSCRAMLKTARLLNKMGRSARAIRRINACRELLELEGYSSSSISQRRAPCG